MTKTYDKTLDNFRYCKYCRYWNYVSRLDSECRRNAPVVMQDGETRFPRTLSTTWCGEIFKGENILLESKDNAPREGEKETE